MNAAVYGSASMKPGRWSFVAMIIISGVASAAKYYTGSRWLAGNFIVNYTQMNKAENRQVLNEEYPQLKNRW